MSPDEPKLLSGGNPQIPKGDGDAPVQAYIAAMPGWKREVGRSLDALIVRTLPGVHKAVRWNSPFYGAEERSWFLSFHCFTKYVKVTFFQGASLQPLPPGESKHADVRYLDIREDDEIDEAQFAAWVMQAQRASRLGRQLTAAPARRAVYVERVSAIVVSDLAYAHPGGDLLFEGVSFKLPPGRHAGLVGANGVGKSTLLRILAGDARAADRQRRRRRPRALHGAGRRHRRGDGARAAAERRPARGCATPGLAMLAAERDLAAGDDERRRAPRRGDRHVVGPRRLRAGGPVGRGLPADRAQRRSPRPATGPRRRSPAASASGSCSSCCSPPTRRCCCSTSPTTSSTSRPSARSRSRSARSRKTVLLISHDRGLLSAASDTILTLEGDGCWVHGASYATYPEARAPSPGADGRPR